MKWYTTRVLFSDGSEIDLYMRTDKPSKFTQAAIRTACSICASMHIEIKSMSMHEEMYTEEFDKEAVDGNI